MQIHVYDHAQQVGQAAATLYTYVSRGWVSRVPAARGRGSLYSRADLERLRARHDARASRPPPAARRSAA